VSTNHTCHRIFPYTKLIFSGVLWVSEPPVTLGVVGICIQRGDTDWESTRWRWVEFRRVARNAAPLFRTYFVHDAFINDVDFVKINTIELFYT
jgi:hypothetical protein